MSMKATISRRFFVGSAAHQVSSTWLNTNKPAPTDADEPPNAGRCIPLAQRFDNTCREPRIGLPVTDAPTLIQVHWRDLVDGCPEASVNSTELTSIAWYFPPSSQDYAIDIHLDDLRFAELDARRRMRAMRANADRQHSSGAAPARNDDVRANLRR